MNHKFDAATLRILDANLNRAREALRVMEEYARFSLDDAILTHQLKKLRHELVGAVPPSIASDLVHCRDIVGDVGREATTAAESKRGCLSEVVGAAAARLTEALRSMEEYGKVVSAEFGATVERLRYDAYELHRRLTRATHARLRFRRVRLYVLITESLCRNEWYETAEAVLRGGADCIQLREKNLNDCDLLDRAMRLGTLCHQHNALFIVNDRTDVARLSGADGVHLGQDDVSVAQARRILLPNAIVGVSTHNEEQIHRAAADAPDYIAVGPISASSTKPQAHIAGMELLQAARAKTSLPLVAIGGLDVGCVEEVSRIPHTAACVCSAVVAAEDPEAATAAFMNAFALRSKLRMGAQRYS